MCIYIQGKGCRMMPEILLNRFDIIPTAQRCHCIRMTQIMEPQIRTVNLSGQFFKVKVNRLCGKVPTEFVCKN